MSEKRFTFEYDDGQWGVPLFYDDGKKLCFDDVVDLLNEQQELIEELQESDEMGWKRAEKFEKKCPKELHNKKMYIKRLEYKVQKFKEENEQLKHYKLYEDNKRLQTIIADLKEENEQLRGLFEEMKQPITINLTEEDEKELRKLLGLIDDE